jgi:hypothetical protein
MAPSTDSRPTRDAGWRRWLVVVVLGAVVATTGDHLHVVYGVLFYPHPALFQQAIWVLPLFAGATFAMIAGGEATRRAMRGASPPGASLAEALLATGWFFVAYAFTAVAAEVPNVVLFVLVVTWLVRVARMPGWTFLFSLLSAVAGVASESTLSSLGGFAYTRPDLFAVPRWLPGLYLHAALAAVRIAPLLVPEPGRVVSRA